MFFPSLSLSQGHHVRTPPFLKDDPLCFGTCLKWIPYFRNHNPPSPPQNRVTPFPSFGTVHGSVFWILLNSINLSPFSFSDDGNPFSVLYHKLDLVIYRRYDLLTVLVSLLVWDFYNLCPERILTLTLSCYLYMWMWSGRLLQSSLDHYLLSSDCGSPIVFAPFSGRVYTSESLFRFSSSIFFLWLFFRDN